MGTDIHFTVEQRTPDGWHRVEALVPNPYAEYDDEPALERERWYRTRHYRVFAVLAGIRNGSGFAGVDTGDPVEPIALPRGLPDDIAPETVPHLELGDHDISWLTLRELLEYPWWTGVVTNRCWAKRNMRAGGLLDGPAMQKLFTDYGSDVYHFDGVETCADSSNPTGWTPVEWTEPIAKSCDSFMPVLARLSALAMGDVDSVRIVFGFDS